MDKDKKHSKKSPLPRQRPALSPEAREDQLIALAVDRAEQQLIDGTASAQVITHYLKLGSSRERLEKEKTASEVELLQAKADSIKSAKRVEELYEEALNAMKHYGGMGGSDDAYDT